MYFQHFFHFSLPMVMVVLMTKVVSEDYKSASLEGHNKKRALHQNVSPIEMDQEMNEIAEKCAQYYVDNRIYDHTCPFRKTKKLRPFKSYGENIYLAKFIQDPVEAANSAIELWYDEIKDWDFVQGSGKDGKTISCCLHFTQIVWKNTTKLGVGYAKDPDWGNIIVAIYGMPGNYAKTMKENVPPLA